MENIKEVNLDELAKAAGGTSVEYVGSKPGPAAIAYHLFNVQLMEKYGKRGTLRDLTTEEYNKFEELRKAFAEESDGKAMMFTVKPD